MIKSTSSIRRYLVALGGSVVLVVLVVLVLSGYRSRTLQLRAADEATTQLAGAAVAQVDGVLDEARQLLETLSAMAPGLLADGSCVGWPRVLPRKFTNVILVGTDRSAVCSLIPGTSGEKVAYQQGLWLEALQGGKEFVVSDPGVGARSGKWIVAVGVPIRAHDGAWLGAVALGIDLVDLQSTLTAIPAPQGSLITIDDRDLTVLARSRDPDRWVGTQLPADPSFDTTQVSGHRESMSLEGEEMLFAFQRLPDLGWEVWAGAPRNALMAPVRASMIEEGVLALSGSILVLLLTGFTYRRIMNPTFALVDTVSSAVLGNTDRIDFEGPRELADLARRFDATLEKSREAEERLRRSREQLRALASQLREVQEDERRELARELHDEIGQAMTGLQIDLSWLRQPDLDRREVQERLDAMAELIDAVLDTTRRISTRLRPSVLDDLGLEAAVAWLADDLSARSGLECEVQVIDAETPVQSDVATALFRILQEALTNVVRHAGAKSVSIRIDLGASPIRLEVADDGRGASFDEVNRPTALGVLGMKERAAALGGSIEIGPGHDGGTVLRVSIPRHADAE